MLEKVIAKKLPSFVILFRMHERGTASEEKSKRPGREKVLNFAVGINITPLNYSFVPKSCFKLLFCT